MFYAYILRSVSYPNEIYIGHTRDLRSRLARHNSGRSPHTRKFIPWTLASYVALPTKPLAERLERYLKTGSGRSFANRHLRGPVPNRRNEG